MKRMHLRLDYAYGKPPLCGKQSNNYQYVETYLKYPNLNDYYHYNKGYEWCQDCITHPDVIMARLNETNV